MLWDSLLDLVRGHPAQGTATAFSPPNSARGILEEDKLVPPLTLRGKHKIYLARSTRGVQDEGATQGDYTTTDPHLEGVFNVLSLPLTT